MDSRMLSYEDIILPLMEGVRSASFSNLAADVSPRLMQRLLDEAGYPRPHMWTFTHPRAKE